MIEEEEVKTITLPYNFIPRDYQLPLFEAMDRGIKRAVLSYHRRGGKDLACWNLMLKKAMERVGNYFYIFPEYSQARKSFWDNITEDGVRFLDYCPKEITKKMLNHEMKIFLVNGSIIQVVGSDKPDSLRGSNPVGVVLSEFAWQNPSIWLAILDSILEKNGGWAIFNSTPQGKNYFYTLLKHAESNPEEWYSTVVTIEDSKLIDPESLKIKLSQGISQEMLDQEYYCSFDVGKLGAYFAKQLKEAAKEKRIGKVIYDKNFLVYTAWDIGISDAMAIVFFQKIGNEIFVIDHYENSGFPLQHYIDVLREKSYNYATHYLPHDGKKRDAASGSTFVQVARESGYQFSIIENKLTLLEGIEKIRGIFSRIYIDEDKCDYLIKCLGEYHSEWDDNAKIFRNRPLHNWASHSTDAFRYMCLALDNLRSPSNSMSKEKLRDMKRKFFAGEM
jgi:hypothetical protein